MSCQLCSDRQEALLMHNDIMYYRWKNANVAMVGCDQHLKEIFEALSNAQKEAI